MHDKQQKQEILTRLFDEPEIGARKLRNRYTQLVDHIESTRGAKTFCQGLHDYLHDIDVNVCAAPDCDRPTKYTSWARGYREFCSHGCCSRHSQSRRDGIAEHSKRKQVARQARVDTRKQINTGCVHCGGPGLFWGEMSHTWRCSERIQECPTVRSKMNKNISVATKGITHEQRSVRLVNASGLCDYGCGEPALWYHPSSSRYTCCASHQTCSVIRTARSKLMKRKYQCVEARELFLSRLRATNQIKYNCDYVGSNPDNQRKIRETTRRRYGVDHIAQYEPWREARERRLIIASPFARKHKALPSGKIVQLQGFEPSAVDELLQLYPEHDLMFGRDVPRFPYEFAGKNHNYYPDVFVVSANLIVEVKSIYWYMRDWYKNQEKRRAVEQQGYAWCWKIYGDPKDACLSQDEIELVDQAFLAGQSERAAGQVICEARAARGCNLRG